jgi:hypothetical protein
LKGFGVMNQQSSSTMRFHLVGLKVLDEGQREDKSAKSAIWFKILLGNIISTKNHHKKDLMVDTRL